MSALCLQQKNMLKSFSNQLSSIVTRDTTSCLSVVTDKIIHSISATIQQHKPVSTASVGTQTSSVSPATSNSQLGNFHNTADHTGASAFVAYEATVSDLHIDATLPSTQASYCPSSKCESNKDITEEMGKKSVENSCTSHGALQDISNRDASNQTCQALPRSCDKHLLEIKREETATDGSIVLGM